MKEKETNTELTIEQVKKKYEMQLLTEIDGITGIGIGDEAGKPVIKVYVEKNTKPLQEKIPRQLEGYCVRTEVTGEFKAL